MTTSTARDEWARVNGLRIRYQDRAGPTEDAPVVVLLHGFTGHLHAFDPFLDDFAERYRVIAPDARGHGESEWAIDGDYSPEVMADDVARLLGALGIERALVVGISMGGRAAFHLAASHPDLVERLALVETNLAPSSPGTDRIRRLLQSNDRFATVDEAVDLQAGVQVGADRAALRERVRGNLMLQEDGSWTWRYDVALRRGEGLPAPDPAQWDRIATILAPTLLLRGETSEVLLPDDAVRFVATAPDAKLIEVAGVGHSVALQAPDEFRREVLDFLAG